MLVMGSEHCRVCQDFVLCCMHYCSVDFADVTVTDNDCTDDDVDE